MDGVAEIVVEIEEAEEDKRPVIGGTKIFQEVTDCYGFIFHPLPSMCAFCALDSVHRIWNDLVLQS